MKTLEFHLRISKSWKSKNSMRESWELWKSNNFKIEFANYKNHRISNENNDTDENHRVSMRESRKPWKSVIYIWELWNSWKT